MELHVYNFINIIKSEILFVFKKWEENTFSAYQSQAIQFVLIFNWLCDVRNVGHPIFSLD